MVGCREGEKCSEQECGERGERGGQPWSRPARAADASQRCSLPAHSSALPARLIMLRRFLIAVAGNRWSPGEHKYYPTAFKRVARTLLLANSCRGFGGRRAPGEKEQQQEHLPVPPPAKRVTRSSSRAAAEGAAGASGSGRGGSGGYGADGAGSRGGRGGAGRAAPARAARGSQGRQQGRGVSLPADLILRILGLAAEPSILWLPQLHPYLEEEERRELQLA